MKHAIILLVLCCLAISGCKPMQVNVVDAQSIPEHLSDWGVLGINSHHLRWSDQVEPYGLVNELFTDYALKFRTLYVPDQLMMQSDGKQFTYPVGSIITKTFFYPKGQAGTLLQGDFENYDFKNGIPIKQFQLVETRLLVHFATGWQAISYVWNEEQDEATREIVGDIQTLNIKKSDGNIENFHYVVPDEGQCIGCHATNFANKKTLPIGPSEVSHVNRKHLFKADNQLESLQQRGWLKNAELSSLPTEVNWRDTGATKDERARSYLQINCAHCHSETGPGNTSGMWLDKRVTSEFRIGVCKKPIAAGQGTGGHTWGISPGNSAESILVYRMMSTDPGAMMPELGRSLVHQEGVELMSDWIDAMDGECPEQETLVM